MIRYIKLKNYKSLVNIEIDLMKTKNKSKNLVLIYGENGIGKSNLVNSLFTLIETMNTMSSVDILKQIIESSEYDKITDTVPQFDKLIKTNFKDIKRIINDCKTIDSKDNMIIEYGFMYNKKNGVYKIEMDNEKIINEKLEYVINKNQTYYFDINKNNIRINNKIFKDKKYYKNFLELIDKYWGKHSFLSILSYEIQDKKKEYMDKKISKNLYNVLNFLKSLSIKTNIPSNINTISLEYKEYDLSFLEKGEISKKQEKLLNKNEYLINEIFTNLYSDIKQVYYKKTFEKEKIKYKLFTKKMIYNEIKDIDFSLESTGTQRILELIPFIIDACNGNTVIIDELDTGIHDLLVKNLLENVIKYIKGQLIITTHNTMLINSAVPKDNIYIFNVNKNAEKELIAITDFEEQLQKNNNPQKKYEEGLFGGIPITSEIDFDELIESLK